MLVSYELFISTDEYQKYENDRMNGIWKGCNLGVPRMYKYMLFKQQISGLNYFEDICFETDILEELKLKLAILGVGKVVSTKLLPRGEYFGKSILDSIARGLLKVDYTKRNKKHFVQIVQFDINEV